MPEHDQSGETQSQWPTAWRPAVSASLSIAILVVALAGGMLAQSPAASGRRPVTGMPLPSPAPDALKVVTTTTVFADIVRNVAREHADVVSIIPAGVGPEDYEPRPEDALLLADADLIVSNGVGLDDFLQKLLESGTGGQTPQLVLGEGIPSCTVDGKQNPHFWLDPIARGAVLRAGDHRCAEHHRPGTWRRLRH